MLHNLGEWWTLIAKPISSSRRRQSPEFLLQIKGQSFGAHSHLPSGHIPIQVAQLAPGCFSFNNSSRSPRVEAAQPWAMHLLELHDHVLPRERVHEFITRWGRQRERQISSWKLWATWLLRPHGPWREQAVHCASAGHKPASHEPEQASQFPWGYISLGVGQARYFLKMTNQLLTLSHALGGSTSQPTPSFPRLD